MRYVSVFLIIFLLASCVSGKERVFTASTPANPVVKTFLGIPLADSVDFIRWKIVLQDKHYSLQCNYGIGKPNTNGFINGGMKIELSGGLEKVKDHYVLHNGSKTLTIAELNTDLLHLLDENKKLLVGNGGWSYTINSIMPSGTGQINMMPPATVLKDSMAFEGRTPCEVPGIISPGTECYKIKWYIILYGNAVMNEPTTYKVYGTNWRKQGNLTGNWKVITGGDGHIMYQLNDDAGKPFITLLKTDDNILVFTGEHGKLLVGDEDFSYTLNRRW
ncbi:MAG TPA: hypothetical protein VIZ28_03225 [Chitinophagaceae bacterium]